MKWQQLNETYITEAKYKELFHVTSTKNAKNIKKEGLLPMQTSNWVTGAGDRYGDGEIYAFERVEDALRWAAKMDFDQNSEMGSGKISIAKISDDGLEEWMVDTNDPISQAGAKGKWLKRFHRVDSKNIKKIAPVKSDVMRKLTDFNATIKPSEVGL